MKHRRGNRWVALGGVMLELMVSMAGLAVSVAVVTVDLDFLIDAIALVVVVDRCFYSFFGKHGAMHLYGGESLEGLDDDAVGELECLGDGMPLD